MAVVYLTKVCGRQLLKIPEPISMGKYNMCYANSGPTERVEEQLDFLHMTRFNFSLKHGRKKQ